MQEQIDFEIDFNMDEIKLDFDLGVDFGQEAMVESRVHKPKFHKPFKEKHVKYSHAEKLSEDIGDITGRVHCLLAGNFIFGDFIEAFIVDRNLHVKRMVISTLSMSQENIDSLHNLLSGGYVDHLDLMVSSYFWGHERAKLIPYAFEKLDSDKNNFQLSVSANHCKIVLIETHCGKNIVIHGSANLRSSNCIEQICIEDNKELFDFNMSFSGVIIEKFNTINKEIPGNRGNKLWQTLKQEAQD